MQMFPFLGWWKSLAASMTGLMTGKELNSSHPGLGAVRRRAMLTGLSQALLGSSKRMGWELRSLLVLPAVTGSRLCDVCCLIP